MYEFYFQKLNVWQNSRKLVLNIYRITNSFPKEERFNFIDQIRRSTCSVSNNIAEGSSKRSRKEQARYTSIACGSLMELLNLMILSRDLKYITDSSFNTLSDNIEVIARQLNALLNTQLKSARNLN